VGVHQAEDGIIYANSDWRKGWESQPAGYWIYCLLFSNFNFMK